MTAAPSALGVSPADAPRAQPIRDPRIGALLMAVAALSIPIVDAIAKALGPGGAEHGYFAGAPIPPLETAFVRFALQCLLLAPVLLLLSGRAALRPKKPGLALLGGLLIAGASMFFFTGVQVMPMAEMVAIFFVEPLLLTLLSAAILGERLTLRRILAVLAGLFGAMLILQPNLLALGPAALLPLGAALCFALYLLVTKRLSGEENALTFQVWTGLSAMTALGAALGLAALYEAPGAAPVWPSADQALGLFALGVVGALAHLLMVFAFRHAPASRLAPLQYVEIIGAAGLGWLVFAEHPAPDTWIGVAIIVAAGLLVAGRREPR